jgi:hypothetical protein
MNYPIDQLEELARRIQILLGEYHKRAYSSLFATAPFKQRIPMYMEASNRLMTKAGTELLPSMQKVLAEVEALLDAEDKAIIERIRPILLKAQRFASNPTNPLGYAELSSLLMRLAGHLSVRVVARPTIFVGYRYTKEDKILATNFAKLFELEGFLCISGKTAQARDFDDKVKELIAQSEGVIVILTKEKELKEGGWATARWLTDEKAYAMGRDKPVLLFFEDCIAQSERKGIHGELEYVEFNREDLDEAFLKAIPYLRDFRQRVLEQKRKYTKG